MAGWKLEEQAWEKEPSQGFFFCAFLFYRSVYMGNVTVFTSFGIVFEDVILEKSVDMPGFYCIYTKDGSCEIVNSRQIVRVHCSECHGAADEFVVQTA